MIIGILNRSKKKKIIFRFGKRCKPRGRIENPPGLNLLVLVSVKYVILNRVTYNQNVNFIVCIFFSI
jgi:hypothetical protein